MADGKVTRTRPGAVCRSCKYSKHSGTTGVHLEEIEGNGSSGRRRVTPTARLARARRSAFCTLSPDTGVHGAASRHGDLARERRACLAQAFDRDATSSPGPTQRVSTTLPSSTNSPARRPRPSRARRFASQARASKGWPMTARPSPRPTSVPFSRVTPRSAARSRSRHLRDRGPENAAGIEEVVGDQGRHAERPVVTVAVVDDLHRGEHRLHGRGDARPVERRARRPEIGPEAHGDLALGADADVVPVTHVRPVLVNRGRVHAAGARAGNPEEGLHDGCRAADLVAGDGPEPRALEKLVQFLLDRVPVHLVSRPHVGRQRGDRRAPEPRVPEDRGGAAVAVGGEVHGVSGSMGATAGRGQAPSGGSGGIRGSSRARSRSSPAASSARSVTWPSFRPGRGALP